MEIWHRVAFDADTKLNFKKGIDKLGIKYKITPGLKPNKIGLISFDIAESHPHWQEVEQLLRKYPSVNMYETIFSEKESLEATWCRLMPAFEQGYPQPESTWPDTHITYEGTCAECGVYARQKESFRIKKEPHLGRKQFMSLYWTSALLATPTVLAEFAARQLRGYEIWPVLIHKTSQPAEKIAQLYVPNITRAVMIPEAGLPRKTCSLCGVTKYEYHKRGYMQFDRALLDTDLDFMMTGEWFGSGHLAFREMLVSRRVAQLIIEHKWQGVSLKPVLPLS